MKVKSYSLIEILIATLIFMVVIMVAVSAFALVKRSNEISGDYSKTDECARQIENFVSSIFRSASLGNPRIMAIMKEGDHLKLQDLSEIPDSEMEADGFSVFENSTDPQKINSVIIYKNIDNDNSGYYYQATLVNKTDLKNGLLIAINNSQKIHPRDCKPLYQEVEGFNGTYNHPFILKLSYPSRSGPYSQIDNPIYSLTIDDLLYSVLSAQDSEDKSNSRLYLKVINNIKPI